MSDNIEPVECSSCSGNFLPDDMATTRGGDILCEDCRIYCERCDNYDYAEGSRYVQGCGVYCEVCADNYTYWCESCEETYSDNYTSYEVADIGVYWCGIVVLIMPTGAIIVMCITEIVARIVRVVG